MLSKLHKSKMNLSNQQIENINCLTSFAMLLVIFTHGILVLPNNLSTSLCDYILFRTFTRVAVPLFFFISGFLFFNNIKKPYKAFFSRKIINRLKSLGIPYVFWTITTFIFFYIATNLSATAPYFKTFIVKSYSCTQMIEAFTTKPINAPFCFIRDLLLISILSPVLWTIYIKKLYIPFSIIIFLCWTININIYIFSFEPILFFNLGLIVSQFKIHFYHKVQQSIKKTEQIFV